MADNYVLEVKKLNTSFITDKKEVKIIKDVSFKLKKGTILALVGESGCGKSVTVNSVMRMLPKNSKMNAEHVIYRKFDDEGNVVNESRIDQMKNNDKAIQALRGEEISMIFQDPMVSLNPVYRVGDQIIEGLLQHHPEIKKKEALQKAVDLLKELDIPAAEQRINEYPHQFSGGMKQRIVIATAMIQDPEIIIADEPTTALDVTIQAQILELMKELQQKKHKSIIIITHNMGIVADMADEVAVMYMGRIVEQGDIKEIFENPMHPYTKALLSSVPVLGEKKERLTTISGSTPAPSELKDGCEFADRCPFASEKCRQGLIPLYKKDEDHFVRCLQFADLQEVNENE